MSSHTLLGIGHLSMLGLKFNHVCERGPWRFVSPGFNSTTNSLIFLWKYDIMISYNCYIYHHSLFCFVLLCHQGFLDIEMGGNMALRWRHNGHDSVSKHQPHDCLLNRLFRHRSKKTSKLRVTGLCTGNSPGTGEFPAQMPSNAENVSIWWRHHGLQCYTTGFKNLVIFRDNINWTYMCNLFLN